MTPDQIKALAAQGESSTIEFKVRLREVGTIAPTLCAFANGRGGTLLVGVDDRGKILGVADGPATEKLIHAAARRIEPPITPATKVLTVDGQTVVVGRVSASDRWHAFEGKLIRRMGERDQPASLVDLYVSVVSEEAASAAALKALLERRREVKGVQIHAGARGRAFDLPIGEGRINCIFIDIFSSGIEDSLEFISQTRTRAPAICFCLFSRGEYLAELPGVDDPWRERLGHYFKLPSDLAADAMDERLDGLLFGIADLIQVTSAHTQLTSLRHDLALSPSGDIDRRRVVEVAEAAEKALQLQRSPALHEPLTVVPGLHSEGLEALVRITLERSSGALSTTKNVNIAILSFGALLITFAFVAAVYTGQWQAVAFGGMGVAGIIASLIANPLRSIGATSRRLVQVQIAYLNFLKQLHMLSQDVTQANVLERSTRLSDEMERTLKALEQHLGDKH